MTSIRTIIAGLKTLRKKKACYLRPAKAPAASVKFHDLVMNDISGKPFPFSQLKGKKTLIVNTASECAYTYQYELLENFYQKYKEKVNVIGFPCNDFGGQEPGSATGIQTFCTKNYGVSFTMFEKVNIKTEPRAGLYNWLSDKKMNGWCNHLPHWNFCKYLIDESGELLLFTNPLVEPDDKAILNLVN